MHCSLQCCRLLLALCLFCAACDAEQPPVQPTSTQLPEKPDGGCRTCHDGVLLDARHEMHCDVCHGGDPQSPDKATAHLNLIARPAEPRHAPRACAPCHPAQVQGCSTSSHYTLRNEINQVRRHFGIQGEITSSAELTAEPGGSDPASLVNDLLRRHCLRCHVHDPGDDYAATRHGLGCAACHLARGPGRELIHHFLRRPGDQQCLTCHRGGFVGSDYHGITERDTTAEFRTPYAGPGATKEFGIELHRLTPDVHQQAGIACIDCHEGKHLMADAGDGGTASTCLGCHGWRPEHGTANMLEGLRVDGTRLLLKTKLDGKELVVPFLRHPAHKQHENTVDCVVCHAQWSGNDHPTHLLRQEGCDFSFWLDQAVQGNSILERFLADKQSGKEIAASCRDRFSGDDEPGIWLQGFGQRRWEEIIIRRDGNGRLRVFRPLLDLRLSAVDGNGGIVADNIRGGDDGYRPYTPHTIGRAGSLYRLRLRDH